MSTAQKVLVPSPRGLPIIGTLPQLIRDPLAYTTQVVSENRIAKLHIGTFALYLISHPDYIQKILQSNNRNYSKETPFSDATALIVGQGMSNVDGALWLRQRRLMQPAFHYRQIMRLMAVMLDVIKERTSHWQAVAAQQGVINISQDMTKITTMVTVHALFGNSLDQVTLDKTTQAIETVLNGMTKQLVFSMMPAWLPLGQNQAFQEAMQFFDQVVYQLIEAGRGQEDDTLLSMLIHARDEETGASMDDRQIRDEVITLLLAGLETTSTTLAWLWYWLARKPEVQAKAQAEIDRVLAKQALSAEVASELQYTRMVVEETLRYYPPGWMQMRKALHDDTLDGYTIPQGATIVILPYATHHDAQWWEQPEEFLPERFTPEQAQTRHRYAYLPFGAGPRKCIANEFAMTEMQLVAAHLLRSYTVRLKPGWQVGTKAAITLKPDQDVELILQAR